MYWASKVWWSSYPDIHTDAPAYKINGYNIKLKLVYYVRKNESMECSGTLNSFMWDRAVFMTGGVH